jgi:hypothetical protein
MSGRMYFQITIRTLFKVGSPCTLLHLLGLCLGLTFRVVSVRATEMRAGLDSKRGLPKLFHARAYRKYAQETYHIARVFVILSESSHTVNLPFRQTVSDRARDDEFYASLQEAHVDPEQLSRTVIAAEATYRFFLSCKDLFPTPEKESNWVKSAWPVACNKTGARLNLSPPGGLAERVCFNSTTHY